MQVSIAAPAVVVSGLPFGAVVTFTEDAPDPVLGATFNSATFSPTSVTIGNGTQVDVIVTNDYTQQLGSFSIDKALSGTGASLIVPATLFTVNYSVDGGPSVPVQVSVDGAPVVVSGLPFGAVVTFTEDTPSAVAGATFNGVTFSPTTVTIGNGTTVAVIATNDYTQQLGSFSIDKALSGSGAFLVPGTKLFTVNYSVDGGPSVPVQVSVDGAPVVVSGLPFGAVVTFTEDTPSAVAGATFNGVTFSPTSVTIGNGTTVAVIATNDYTQQLGSFSIDKALSGTGASLVSPTQTFVVNYSVDGGPSVAVPVSIAAPAVVVSGLPFGAVVTFTEDAPDPVLGATFNSATFSPTSVTIGNGTQVDVIVTNDYTQQLGSFSIDKALSGTGASLIDPATLFTVNYSVDGGPSVPVQVSVDGAPVVVSGLPFGAVVTFTEDTPTAVAGATFNGVTFSPTTVTIGNGTTVAVIATNDYTQQLGSFSIDKALSGTGASLGFPGTKLFTVNYSVDGGPSVPVQVSVDGAPVVVSGCRLVRLLPSLRTPLRLLLVRRSMG